MQSQQNTNFENIDINRIFIVVLFSIVFLFYLASLQNIFPLTTNIQGSHLAATDKISIQTGELNITNSKDTTEHQNEKEHGHVIAQMTVYGASGGASITGSFDRSKNSDTTTTVNNSTLTADKIVMDTLGDLNIRGGNVHADSQLVADVDGDLNVESQQNRSRSKNTGMGVSAGMSFGGTGNNKSNVKSGSDVGGASGVNGGLNASNGMSYTKETVLSSFTSGGTADIHVKGNTQITGALIGTIDENGKDLNQLNLTTNSLHFTDLRNINVSRQTSAGVSTNLSVAGANGNPREGQTTAQGANGKTLSAQTSNLKYENSQTNDASKTLATLGHGTIKVGGTTLEENGKTTEAGLASDSPLIALNRDTERTTKELWHSTQAQTVDATLDHRLLTKEGRAEIKQQMDDMPENVQKIAQNVPKPTGGTAAENAVGKFLNNLSDWTLGVLPSHASNGGVIAQIPVLLGANDIKAGAIQIRDANDQYVLDHPDEFMKATDLDYFDTLEAPGKAKLEGKVVSIEFVKITSENATYQNHTNGILNNLPQALVNGMEQTGSSTVTEFYNPSHGILGDLLESGEDKFAGNSYIHSGTAAQTGNFVFSVIQARGNSGTNIVAHSQGTLLINAGLSTLDKNKFSNIDFSTGGKPTFFINGAAVEAKTINENLKNVKFTFAGSNANAKDPVAEFLGGNHGLYVPSRNEGTIEPLSWVDRLSNTTNLATIITGKKYPTFDENGQQTNTTSPHSTYDCQINCGSRPPEVELATPDTEDNKSKDENK